MRDWKQSESGTVPVRLKNTRKDAINVHHTPGPRCEIWTGYFPIASVEGRHYTNLLCEVKWGYICWDGCEHNLERHLEKTEAKYCQVTHPHLAGETPVKLAKMAHAKVQNQDFKNTKRKLWENNSTDCRNRWDQSVPLCTYSLGVLLNYMTRLEAAEMRFLRNVNPLNPELNPICYLLALLAHHFLHVSRIRIKWLTLRLLMSYIYGAHILDVSRSHTTTHHSR